MATYNIDIIQKIYVVEVTSYSNNKHLTMYCYDCLAKAKTNRDYVSFVEKFTPVQELQCVKCFKVNIAYAIKFYELSLQKILNLAEAHYPLKTRDTNESVQFNIGKEYLSILKGKARHGKR